MKKTDGFTVPFPPPSPPRSNSTRRSTLARGPIVRVRRSKPYDIRGPPKTITQHLGYGKKISRKIPAQTLWARPAARPCLACGVPHEQPLIIIGFGFGYSQCMIRANSQGVCGGISKPNKFRGPPWTRSAHAGAERPRTHQQRVLTPPHRTALAICDRSPSTGDTIDG